MANAEGSGSVKTYLAASRAEAHVDAEVALSARAAEASENDPTIDVALADFDIDDYTVFTGVPSGRGDLEVRHYTRCGIGEWIYSDVPPAPAELSTGATMRWLPSDASFTQFQGWTPFAGAGASFVAQPQSSPYLDNDYSFSVRGGDEVELPAVIFSGDGWMQLDNTGWAAQAFTVAIVAVLHPNDEGPVYGVMESYSANTDPAAPVDWGLRYRQGVVELYAGATVLTHAVAATQSRPVVLALALEPGTGRFVAVDRNKSTRSFSTEGIQLFDLQLLLGRSGGDYDASKTAQMDVLEVDLFDRALTFDELADLVHTFDSIYGVVG